MSLAKRMESLEVFLAWSVALEEEAADRHDELADMMEVHHNTAVAGTFRKLARYSRLHASEIRDHALGRALPTVAPWDFGWETMEGPETSDIADVDYLMTTLQALKVAMGNERRAHDFYASVSEDSPDAEVRDLAAAFALEEKEHLELLQQWLDTLDETEDAFRFDPDPPHMPE